MPRIFRPTLAERVPLVNSRFCPAADYTGRFFAKFSVSAPVSERTKISRRDRADASNQIRKAIAVLRKQLPRTGARSLGEWLDERLNVVVSTLGRDPEGVDWLLASHVQDEAGKLRANARRRAFICLVDAWLVQEFGEHVGRDPDARRMLRATVEAWMGVCHVTEKWLRPWH